MPTSLPKASSTWKTTGAGHSRASLSGSPQRVLAMAAETWHNNAPITRSLTACDQ
ncbi:hypothetical protein ABGB18_08720 [Nonomuraea sp. B12E4]|uniref:hypothetical protein n=1 Tax=Nonomuraea sp. B12E4 TaxID=3153564 RepID=UPI00325C4468